MKTRASVEARRWWSLGLLIAVMLCTSPAWAQTKTWTLTSDFNEGTALNVNTADDELKLNRGTAAFNFVNIAASARGTMVRIDSRTGEIVGEYLTAPDGRWRNPSRTTVDLFGNVWVTNRDEASSVNNVPKGSIVRVGIIMGGTRVDADETPNANGQYLMGPFSYNTCDDRDGDGLIKTSRGLGDYLPWPNTGLVDNDGGVETAEDECIINYTRVAGTNTRTAAVDANNDVWVGGTGNRRHEKIDGATGQPVLGTEFVSTDFDNRLCGGYGGLIDGNGVLWSMTSGPHFLRYDPALSTGTCIQVENYGVGIDPTTGEIWITQLSGNAVHKLDKDGNVLGTFSHGNSNAQGVAVDSKGNVWVAHSLFSAMTVGHVRTDGTYIGNVPLPGGNGPTGVAIDADGKVWVANINTSNAMRIDPAKGPLGADGVTPVGEVDLIVDLNRADLPNAGPYNYSDMTGAIAVGSTAPKGTWSAVYDGGRASLVWEVLSWTESVPQGATVMARVRAANQQSDLPSASYLSTANGAALSGVVGRYVEVEVELTRDPANPSGDTPVVFDVTIKAETTADPCQDPATAPSWDGSVVEQGGMKYLPIRAPQGLVSLEFYNTENVQVDGFADDAFVDLSADFSQSGNVYTYTGSRVPTKVMVKVSAPAAGNSRFFLKASDTCQRVVDLDPRLTLDIGGDLPSAFALRQNYPNPFNPATTIGFMLPEAAHVTLTIYDVTGREVATLIDATLEVGAHEAVWDGHDAAGHAMASGVYLYHLRTDGFNKTMRMTLLK